MIALLLLLATLAYPRTALYGAVGAHGEPFLRADGSIDTAVCAQHARFDYLVLEPILCAARPDVCRLLDSLGCRRRLAFSNLSLVYFNPARSMGDTVDDLRRLLYRAVEKQGNGFLWSALHRGEVYDPEAIPGPFSHYSLNLCDTATVDAVAAVYAANLAGWSGLFLDYATPMIGWTQNALDSIDIARALGGAAVGSPIPGAGGLVPATPGASPVLDRGLARAADFDAAYLAGHRRLVGKIRDAAPAGFLITGNGGWPDSGEYGDVNGWMREGYPYQSGGTWEMNMVQAWGWPGVFGEDTLMRPPQLSWLNALPGVDAADSARIGRFVAGSAALSSSAVASITTNERPAEDRRWECWLPEYCVRRDSARLSSDLRYRHWLGTTGGRAYLWGVKVWVRNFTYGLVLVNPSVADETVRLQRTAYLIGYPGDRRSKAERAVTSVTVPACDAVFLVR